MKTKTVRSFDGTLITYECSGEGAPVVLIGGALNDRSSQRGIATRLAPNFSVVCYDRRHRGESGDAAGGPGGAEERVEREIEDLRALVQDIGGSASLFGFSSGAALALRAAAELPVDHLALWEAPYQQDPGAPERQRVYSERLEALVAAGRKGDAAQHFMLLTGTPAEQIAQFRSAPWWPRVEALAPSLVYDAAVMGDGRVPTELAARVPAKTLVLAGGGSSPWMRESAEALAAALPDAYLEILEGQNHNVDPAVIAPKLVQFFSQ
ncbi:alpha/beta hydrolase [Deinococcus metallilatus]|uniref:Alpha/beta hydrolase n=1 Tax=Deinococcus metallilatus TaxID=1211322 RepID=A0AAJ5F3Z7_9DEIO|nr:alpha/beta hydrolase [Deinococcus metallilatus]RXJ09548.1 alpha/beta hydrolase [Deinococcus metallilatus]TLK29069.1 alpha/beta hydrolase [Deinococcus metallilatus]GMA16895.1 alpha/beta hydrolase [Deinococcus metallilatus]